MSNGIADTLRHDSTETGGLRLNADRALKMAAQLWFLTTAIGQWIFVFYIVVAYGGSAIRDGLEGLNVVNGQSYRPGEILGNLAFVFHILLAAVIIGGGPLQLIPQIRARFPRFHRWNGRIYIPASLLTSVGGLYLIWTRGNPIGIFNKLGTSLDGVLIIIFGVIALRYAIAGDIKTHRRWALRLFLAVSGVWFFRIGLMAWFTLTGGVGIDKETFTGPFLDFLSFAQSLLPLAMLELYFRVQDRRTSFGRLAMAGGLLVATVYTGIGIFAAFMGLWLPRI
ncbi:MAG: DUF2306 domain-containing protein [Gammaproteobacteria bacterium]|nr:DUF2306 domain-containing protein [Gammaproteobacteria bacterium]